MQNIYLELRRWKNGSLAETLNLSVQEATKLKRIVRQHYELEALVKRLYGKNSGKKSEKSRK